MPNAPGDFGLRVSRNVELRKIFMGYRFQIRNPNCAIRNLTWYRRRDSNPHCLVSKTSASCPLGYAGKISLVDLARFERATSTFAESRSDSPELQVLRLRIAECGLRNGGPGQIILTIRILKSAIRNRLAEAAGVEPARALRDGLANRCHTVRRRLLGLQIAECGLPDETDNSRQSAF